MAAGAPEFFTISQPLNSSVTVNFPEPRQGRPWLYLPVEVQVREFQAKLLLALAAATSGFHVVLGHSLALKKRLPALPPGIYLDKSVTGTRVMEHRRLREAGHRVVAWCEEGLVVLDEADYRSRRIHPECVAGLDLIFAWGERQARLIRSACPDIGGRLILAGNPRTDLLAEPYRRTLMPEAEKIRERHGRFLLVNTNFGFCNHFRGPDFAIESLIKQGKLATQERIAFFREWAAFKRLLMEKMIQAAIYAAARLPDWNFVIRPHPSESPAPYRRAISGKKNFYVGGEGSVHPWLCAASAVLHNGCTTGVEAALLGRPVFAFQPVRDSRFDCEFPNSISVAVSDADELVAALESLDRGEPFVPPHDAGRRISEHLASFGGEASIKKIIAALKTLDAPPATPPPAARIARPSGGLLRAAVRFAADIAKGPYKKRKFPGVSPQAVCRMFEEIRRADPSIRCGIHPIDENVFLVSSLS